MCDIWCSHSTSIHRLNKKDQNRKQFSKGSKPDPASQPLTPSLPKHSISCVLPVWHLISACLLACYSSEEFVTHCLFLNSVHIISLTYEWQCTSKSGSGFDLPAHSPQRPISLAFQSYCCGANSDHVHSPHKNSLYVVRCIYLYLYIYVFSFVKKFKKKNIKRFPHTVSTYNAICYRQKTESETQ